VEPFPFFQTQTHARQRAAQVLMDMEKQVEDSLRGILDLARSNISFDVEQQQIVNTYPRVTITILNGQRDA
jgi:hypothetical protein